MDWNEVVIYKELHFVYIVNGHKFLTEEEAEEFIEESKNSK